MGIVSHVRSVSLVLATVIGLAVAGCGDGSGTDAPAPTDGNQPATAINYAERDWCVEHGVPESQCGQCDAKLAADFQKKGDWCEDHNRPESQCFICNPDAKTKFAATYEAKYGEKPPEPTE